MAEQPKKCPFVGRRGPSSGKFKGGSLKFEEVRRSAEITATWFGTDKRVRAEGRPECVQYGTRAHAPAAASAHSRRHNGVNSVSDAHWRDFAGSCI